MLFVFARDCGIRRQDNMLVRKTIEDGLNIVSWYQHAHQAVYGKGAAVNILIRSGILQKGAIIYPRWNYQLPSRGNMLRQVQWRTCFGTCRSKWIYWHKSSRN